MKKHLGISASVLTLILGFGAAAFSAPPSVLFPAEPNGLEPLSQRFLYAMPAPDQVLIGDILIRSSHITLRLQEDKGQRRFAFQWPAGLFSKGSLSIQGSDGKSLWTTEIDPKGLKTQRGSAPLATQGRQDISVYLSPPVETELLTRFSLSSFVTFCLSDVGPDTKVYLCSRELLLRRDGQTLRFVPRERAPRETFVEINGKEVAPQGIVYLNDQSSDLFMRAQLRTGELLEIMTRRRGVDFLDAIALPDSPDLRLITRGAEPAEGTGLKKLSDDTFQLNLSKERPVYYLLAEGRVPLRQEFLLKGQLPTEKLRPQVSAGDLRRTYSDRITVKGKAAEGTTLRSTTKNSSVQLQGQDFTWTVSELRVGDRNQRQLELRHADKKHVVAMEFDRGRANEARLGAELRVPAMTMTTTLTYCRWLENFLGINSPWTHLRWAVEGSYLLGLNDNGDFPKIGGMIFGLTARLQPGFAEDLSSSGVRLLYGQLKFSEASTSSLGVEYFQQREFKTRWSQSAEWLARVWLGGGSDPKLQMSPQLEAALITALPWRPHLHARWGLGLSQWKTDPALPKESLDLTAHFGLLTFF